MKAIVKLDERHYDRESLNDLIQIFKGLGLQFELVTDYANYLKSIENQSEYYILFQNERYRIGLLPGLMAFLKEHQFGVVLDYNNLNIVAFVPQKIRTKKPRQEMGMTPFLSAADLDSACTFSIKNLDVHYKYKEGCPTLFLYTRERLEYLKLTYNSLYHTGITENLVLVLNQPTPEVEKYASTLTCRKIKILENSGYAAINIAYQIFQPEKFIVCEDDFILPISARVVYPNWVKEFGSRLGTFDLVGWSGLINNIPKPSSWSNELHYQSYLDAEFADGRLWCYDPKVIMGQCLGIVGRYYKDVARYNGCTPVDTHLKRNTRKACMTTMMGYHIGWNQEMDGFKKLGDMSRHPAPKLSYKVEIEGREVVVRPSDLWL